MKIHVFALVVLSWALISCNDNADMKGNLVLDITDSPADADAVKGVNIYITTVDARFNGEWKSLHRFEQPVGINLLEYSGANSFPLIDQVIDPGTLTELRFTLNLADFNSGLVRNPQCNILFEDNSTKPLYFAVDSGRDVTITRTLEIKARGRTAFTFDFDVRKSLIVNDHGDYIFKPVVRTIETSKAGHISGTASNYQAADRVVVFSYPTGSYSSSETTAPASGEVRFKNAVSSSKINNSKFSLGFLEAGSYDLVFAKHSETGEFITVMGRKAVTVNAGETLDFQIDMNTLTGS